MYYWARFAPCSYNRKIIRPDFYAIKRASCECDSVCMSCLSSSLACIYLLPLHTHSEWRIVLCQCKSFKLYECQWFLKQNKKKNRKRAKIFIFHFVTMFDLPGVFWFLVVSNISTMFPNKVASSTFEPHPIGKMLKTNFDLFNPNATWLRNFNQQNIQSKSLFNDTQSMTEVT